MDRSDRRRRQTSLGATLVFVCAVALVAGSCSGSDRDGDAGLGPGSAADASADTTVSTTGPGGAGTASALDRGEPIEMTPDEAFQRLDPSRFANSLPDVIVNDVVAVDDGSWLLAGALEDGGNRTRQPVAIVVDTDGPDGGDRQILPGIAAGLATVTGVAGDEQGYVAVGWEADEGGDDRAVVWTADSPRGNWTAATLPSRLGSRHRAERVVVGAGRRYALGSVGEAGSIRPAVWRARGPAWELLTVVDDHPEDGPDPALGTKETISILGATVAESGLVAVGLSEAAGRDPRPLVWRELGDRMVLEAGSGLPEGGSLRDVLVDGDGSLLAVGAVTEDGRSDPLVARADGPRGPWDTWSVELDLAGWISFDGLEFDRVIMADGPGDDPILLASLTDPVVQQVFRSLDRGRSWERVGDLAADTGRQAPIRSLATAADGAVAAVGGVVARVDPDPVGSDGLPGRWTTLAGPDLLPDRNESLTSLSVAAADGYGFAIGGLAASRSEALQQIDAVVWRSEDGRIWERRSIDDTFGYAVDEVFVTSDERLAGLKAGGSYFTDVHLLSPRGQGDDEQWRSQRLAIGEAFLTDVAPGPGQAVVAAGNRPNDEVSFVEPLFAIIESDGTTREIPMTDSPIPPETNGEVVCLAGGPGGMLAILSWGDGGTGVAVSSNGERWRGLDQVGGLDLRVEDCGRDVDGRFVAAGQDGSGRAAVASSDDGSEWTITTLGEPGVVLGVDRLADRLILSGAVAGADGRGSDGALWSRQGDRWQRLDVAGLEGDLFAPTVEITGLAVADDVVVAIGADRGRAGAWIASAAALGR